MTTACHIRLLSLLLTFPYNFYVTDAILQTKLYIPPIRPELISRSRLNDKLNAGLWQNGRFTRKLTLVSAPAGFGKTTLITAWIHNSHFRPHNSQFSWLSIDEDDNDPHQYFRYIAAAIRPLSTTPLVLNQLLQADQPVPAKTLAQTLVNDVLTVEKPFILVLDDYHLIQSADINEAVTFLLEQMPPHMHLVITSRADPPLPISRLRARQQMTEIRAADLRLNVTEISQLLHTLGLPVTDEQATRLGSRTEGWAAGLQLAAIAMQSAENMAGNHDAFIDSFTGNHRYIMDYLTDEVLHRQPPEIESFLLQTAVLERFCAPLCDFLIVELVNPHSQIILEQLENANLFLVPLDNTRQWYRYHHLFADLLRQRLREQFAAEQIAALHRRAIHWLTDHGLIDEALNHAAAIDEWETVAEGMARLGSSQINQGHANRVAGWLARLPEQVIRTNPRLAVDKAWLHYMAYDIAGLLPWLEIAETLTDDEAHVGETAVIRALHTMVTGDVAGGVAYAEAANNRLGEQHAAAKGGLLFMLGNGYDALGQPAKSGEAFAAAVRYLEKGGNWIGVSGATTLLIRHHMATGRLQKAYTISQQFMHRYATDVRLQNGGGMQAAVYHALVLFERHEVTQLADAEALVTQALALTRLTMSGTAIEIWMLLTLAQIKMARGETLLWYKAKSADVHALIEEADNHLRQLSPNNSLYSYYDFLVGCYLLTGQTKKAQQWIETFNNFGTPPENPITFFNTVHQAEALLQVTPDDDAVLKAVRQQIVPIANVQPPGYVQLRALLVLALIDDALGQSAVALTTLTRVLETAAAEEWVAIFYFADERMEKLLRRLQPQTNHNAFLDRVLAAIAPTGTPHAAQLHTTADGLVTEPLSERELEVLRLVGDGRSNREIADELYLALGTVKRHLSNINGKLHTTSRTQAVARAREFNLL